MKRSRRIAITLLIFLLSIAPALSQQPAPVIPNRAVTLPELQERIAVLLDQPKFASARWGVLITNAEGKVLFERDADKAFMPASNLKLYTSAAALDTFGPEFRIKTSVYSTAPIEKGVLHGDLILYGRGDPNLSPRFDSEDHKRYSEFKPADQISAIENLADQIKARGLRIISGNLIGDDSYFAGDPVGPGWEWDDMQFYYGAEVSALTVNDNVVTFTVTPALKEGQKPLIKVQPITKYVDIVNHATTSGPGQTRIGVHRPLNSNEVEFFGTIPRKAPEVTINIAVHDPALFAATLLREALARRGIKLRGRIEQRDAVDRVAEPLDPEKIKEIAQVESQPLSEILKVVNKQSQNLHAELLLRQLGTRHPEYAMLDDYGRPKQTELLGAYERISFLKKAGIEIEPLNLRDGSGLARQDLVTPHTTARLLEFMLAHPHFDVYRESLALAGVDGTLENRMKETEAFSNFHGKTGSLSHVNSLSGYLTTHHGQMLIVSIMGNNYVGSGRDVTAVLDQICVMLAEFDGE
ncbi:MAG: D-alanyl-D-alanine carboxypeptidase/D-alanyl-D-alanine-endopeptidase [Blastocatellia bacterium]|nr:D-alanyl-D-alanine carboxypeptidase/D-alanyl-D-alanine-endopeptidase [Blastocatellia bacterium]